MQFLVLVYIDPALISTISENDFNAEMRGCFLHADEMTAAGKLEDSQQLEPPATAKSIRVRNGRTSIVDGPFAETKEMLGGFNLIEASSMEEAVQIAQEFPWAKYGCLEVRPVRDMAAVRQRVGA